MRRHTFVLPAEVDRVIDGDSVVVHIGILPGTELHGSHVRIEGINAPELRHAGGPAARDFLAAMLPPETEVEIVASGQDKYGRILGDIRLEDGSSVAMVMLQAGHAVPLAG